MSGGSQVGEDFVIWLTEQGYLLGSKYFRGNDINWAASVTGLGVKGGGVCTWAVVNLTLRMKQSWLNPDAHIWLRQLKTSAEMLNWETQDSHFLLCLSSGRERREGCRSSTILFPSTDSEMKVSLLCSSDIGMVYEYFYLHLRGDSYSHKFLLVMQLWKWAQRMLNKWINNRAETVVIRAQYSY